MCWFHALFCLTGIILDKRNTKEHIAWVAIERLMAEQIFESFLNLDSAAFIEAEKQLLVRGVDALPVLESLLKGEAKNSSGVPYRQFGRALRCALEVALRLGPVAKPLEPYMREELLHGDITAARALGSLGKLEEASIKELAASLDGDVNLSTESAAALINCGEAEHHLVSEAIAHSQRAASVMARTKAYLASRKAR